MTNSNPKYISLLDASPQVPRHGLQSPFTQIPNPTYGLAKRLHELLILNVPSSWLLKSPKEFIDLLHNKAPTGLIASLAAESLFTNGPAIETIDFILDEVYHSNHVPLDIPETLLCKLLEACTTESPFCGPDGKLYGQVDGVAMGSPPLGVLFANFYMGLMERRVLSIPVIRPHSYGRYVDDICVEARAHTHLQELCEAFTNDSCLNFTSEHYGDGSLPLLDISVKPNVSRFTTTVYVGTNEGKCLNADGECPAAYKKSVIRSYVNRAFKHRSSWPLLHQ
ncbi:uncharacterized protein LOC143027522 [Oratosquilla oratoria]|uniref:uncharacterized protein LOC143027522 n=1 Tax=Oratosquilla oratoria TaxID=337810 RepID=UPI003F761B2D